MLETKCVGDLIVVDGSGRFFIPNLFTENPVQHRTPTSGRRHQDLNSVTKIKRFSPVLLHQHHLRSPIHAFFIYIYDNWLVKHVFITKPSPHILSR